MTSTVLLSWVSLLIAYTALFWGGWGVLRLLRLPTTPVPSAAFAALTITLSGFVTVYSVIRTHGITVSWGFVLLGVIALVVVKREPRLIAESRPSGARRIYLELLAVLAVIFALQAYTVYSPKGQRMLVPQDPDRSDLADFSGFIDSTGRETKQVDYAFSSKLGASPYHYYELWMTAGLSSVFGGTRLILDHLVSAPLIGVTLYAGMRAISDSLGVPWLAQLVLCFTLTVFNAEVQLPFFRRFDLLARTEDYYGVSAIEYGKLFTLYLFEIAAMLAWLAARPILAASSLAATSVANVLGVPATVSMALLGALAGMRKRTLSRNQFLCVIGVTGAAAFFVVIFYRLFADPVQLHGPAGLKQLVNAYRENGEARISLHIVGASLIQVVYMTTPYWLLALIYRKELRAALGRERVVTQMLWLLGAGAASALLTWALIHFLQESHQLFERNVHVAINLTVLLLLSVFFKIRKREAWIFLGALAMIKAGAQAHHLYLQRQDGLNAYSEAYIEKVAAASQGLNPMGVYFKGASEYQTVRDESPVVRPGHYLGIIDSRFYPMSLSIFDSRLEVTPASQAAHEAFLASASFYKFVELEKSEGRFASFAQSQLDFLDRYGIQYAILSPAAELPTAMAARATQVLRDDVSGERFVVLSPPAR